MMVTVEDVVPGRAYRIDSNVDWVPNRFDVFLCVGKWTSSNDVMIMWLVENNVSTTHWINGMLIHMGQIR